ncbi:YlqD family protein [Ammoniphilus resinae]|uniref:YlqD protein n=1 Tax=Ammoniphilus resinae TaxID=861532 RepID=A0ABS4GKT6_9BACL|nr:YlqD family protein [Ammoniphilus resinae]MBP1930762.1 hypothetical protein [Ammoniphilus resinae]
MVKIKRPIIVKMVLTGQVRLQLEKEYKQTIRKYEMELEQLQFQSKKLLQEASRKGVEAQRLVQDRLTKEERVRKEKIVEYKDLISQLALVPDGSEIEYAQLEGEVEVNVGDDWDKLIGSAEIVVKDGIIVEIRNEGERR